jgi:hypothetical protein
VGGVPAAVGGACVLLRAEKGPETTRNDLPFAQSTGQMVNLLVVKSSRGLVRHQLSVQAGAAAAAVSGLFTSLRTFDTILRVPRRQE